MKKNKKLIAMICTVLLLVGAAGATLAWLTDKTDPVTNTFTTSDINIDLKETTGETYEMVPGSDIAKDPKVIVKPGSEACYLFIKVKTAGGDIGQKEDGSAYSFADFIEFNVNTTAGEWTALPGEQGVYYRVVDAETAEAGVTYKILTTKTGFENGFVTVDDDVTKEMMEALKEAPTKYPTLAFKAFAVQSANIANVETAWEEIPETEKTNF